MTQMESSVGSCQLRLDILTTDNYYWRRAMKYFLTGATGFIGAHVARQLVQAGHQVVAVVRNPDRAQDLADLGIAIHKGDVTDKQSMRDPIDGVDGVFHIAGWYK